jgi:DNA-binding Lrp family transcriptional regulator
MKSGGDRMEDNRLYTLQRRNGILRILKKQGSISVNQLAEQFQVSGTTIRLDLTALAKMGVKFVETDNRGMLVGGKNAGKSYSSVYGRKRTNQDAKEAKIKAFFNPLEKAHFKERSEDEIKREILEDFNDRDTQTLVISFDVPDISAD